MKLYDCSTAPSPRRVRIFAAEKGLELDLVQVDLANGEQYGEHFRVINPDCVVPVLELDDGTRISEVLAICYYLDEIKPEPSLFGTTPLERAETLMWNAKVEQQGLMSMMDAFRNVAKGLKGHALPGPDEFEQIPALAERGRRRVEIFFRRLDDRLSTTDFIAGGRYSIADISGLVLIDFAKWVKIPIPNDAGNLQRWYKAITARPSAKA